MLTIAQTDSYLQQSLELIEACQTQDSLLQIQSKLLNKGSELHTTISSLSSLSIDEKKSQGPIFYKLRQALDQAIKQKKQSLETQELNKKLASQHLDISLPVNVANGGLHPVTKIKRRIESIFINAGFQVETGAEIENDYYNFEALNIPKNHSARATHDTFYFDANLLLRTHTSSVQIHVMEEQKPPIHIVCPGRVYRHDSDATHTPMFHQIEGLVVDSNSVSLAHLKGLLTDFLHSFFAKEVSVRFRPSYFPFTEPSVEVDIGCIFCKGSGCRVCSHSGWIEVLGAGMVHPNVLANVNLDPTVYQALAFGMGIERLTMLYYGINDLRLLYENNWQLLNQYEAC